MARANFLLENDQPKVVGSFGSATDLAATTADEVRKSCDLAEIRLDLLDPEATRMSPVPWGHLSDIPLLFTVRRIEEGGAVALDADSRTTMLERVLVAAAFVDVEVASISGMARLLAILRERRIPWVASYHDFEKIPSPAELSRAAELARAAGAAVFKAAARLESPADLARLAEFQLADHGLPVSTMGMGPLAPVSRLLCAQCGSVLNYGYLGNTATAPGQWDSALLKNAIARLTPFRP